MRNIYWRRDATWREVIIICALIVLVIGLIGIAR